jgi:beta-phosphoglucomutase
MAGVAAAWAATPDRAVLFDFNGTLSDDEPLLFGLFAGVFAERFGWDLTPGEYADRLAGRSDREILDVVCAEHAPGDAGLVEELLVERGRRYRELVRGHDPVRPATADLVRLLDRHGVPVGVVTGAQRDDVDAVLRAGGLAPLVRAVVAAEDVTAGKPHPEGFLRGAELLGVPPTSVLVFEDSLFGLRAARAAGMRAVAVVGTRQRHELEAEADAVVDALTPGLLSAVLGPD